jgi:diaminohydroxyphosphoribosylaminopyrimidine deaminase/5-amino-6-(5-phosphoribosylamino)uracil reductase
MQDPNPEVKGGGIQFLRRHGVQVSVGVCEKSAKRLNEAFIKFISTRRPFIVLKCAATLDGRIATRTNDARWVTGENSRKFVHQLRHAVDAILVGINTVQIDNPSLTTRLADDRGKDPTRIILDTNLRISPDARVLRLDSDSDTILVAAEPVAKERRELLERDGVRILDSPTVNGVIDMQWLMGKLGTMGITSLLIEGGGRVIAAALNAGIVDKIMFFYAPKILGGDDGVAICRGEGAELMNDCIQVRDIIVRRFDEDVMIEGYIEKD